MSLRFPLRNRRRLDDRCGLSRRLRLRETVIEAASSSPSLPPSLPGTIHAIFEKSNNHYTWKKVTTTVHNIIVGKLWIDQVGSAFAACVCDALREDLCENVTPVCLWSLPPPSQGRSTW